MTELVSRVSINCGSSGLRATSDNEFTIGDETDLFARISAIEREPDIDDHEAIRNLEPLLAEAFKV